MFRVGSGYDAHRLVEGRPLILGGVEIPYTLGLLGHSDADVLTHAVMDAIIGALGMGDIGQHFPDTDPAYSGVDSRSLLMKVNQLLLAAGYKLANADLTIIAEAPKLAPFIGDMRDNIAADLGADISQVNVKATTTEKLGFVGRGEGISAHAVVLLETIVTSN